MSDEVRVNREDVITRKEKNSPTEKLFGKFNKVFVSGKVEDDFVYSHQFRCEKFYRTRLIVQRISGEIDFIPLVVPELLLKTPNLKEKWLEVTGQFRSRKKLGKEGKKHLEVYLFVTQINVYEEESELEESANSNLIYLQGEICKPPVYRTPLGRKLTDVLVIVYRGYGCYDCIPCITWGRTARWVKDLEVGTQLQICGRIQSRKYFRGENLIQVYEVSVMKIEKL